MKRYLVLLLCAVTLSFISCSNDGASTDGGTSDQKKEAITTSTGETKQIQKIGNMSNKYTNHPAHDWVVDVLKANNDSRAIQCKLNGEVIYFITECASCPKETQLAEVFKGNQEKVCEIGGQQMVNTCSDALREGTEECKAIFLE